MKTFSINNQELNTYLKKEVDFNLSNITPSEYEKYLKYVKDFKIISPIPSKIMNTIFSISNNYKNLITSKEYKNTLTIKIYHWLYSHKIYTHGHIIQGKCQNRTKEYLLQFVKSERIYRHKLLEAYINDFKSNVDIYTTEDINSLIECLNVLTDRINYLFTAISKGYELSCKEYTFLTCIPYEQLSNLFEEIRKSTFVNIHKESTSILMFQLEEMIKRTLK